MGGVDWGELALVSRVDQWVETHPYFFMISRARLIRPGARLGHRHRHAGDPQSLGDAAQARR